MTVLGPGGIGKTSVAHALARESALPHVRVVELVGVGAGDDVVAAVGASLGVRDEIDMRNLLPLQEEDGGWEIGWIYRYGISGMKIGSRGYTTTMAIKAIEDLDKLRARDGEV